MPVVMVAQADVDSLFRQFENGGKGRKAESAKQLVRLFEQEGLYDHRVPDERNRNNSFSEMLVWLGMGNHELDNGNYVRAVEMGRKAEELAPGDSLRWLASCYELLDAAYLWQGDYPKSIEYALKDYEIGERLGDDKTRSTALNALAAAYCYTRLYDKALNYIDRAVEIERKGHDDKALSIRLGLRCEILLLLNRPAEALEAIGEAIDIDRRAGRVEKVAIRLSQKADILANQAQWEECRATCQEALAIFQQTGNIKEKIIALKQLGGCETALKLYDSAETHLLESERLCLETGFLPQLWRVRKHLSGLYKETGQYQKAFEYLELSTALNDSLQEERQQKIIGEYQTRFELKEKEQELEAQRDANRNRNILSITLLIIAILAAILAFSGYKLAQIRKKRNAELASMNFIKDQFFALISHDLKNPVRAQTQLLGYLSAHYDEVDDSTKKKQIQALKESGDRLSELLTNLLDWARIQTGQVNYIPMRVDLAAVIRRNMQLMQPIANDKQITITSDLEAPCYVFTNLNAADTILRNLLSNAVKFSHQGGTIEIVTKPMEESVSVSVVDHGIGMSEAQKESVFNMRRLTTLGTKEETGTGLGLLVCKNMADNVRGVLTFESVEGQGSTFTLTLPADEHAYDRLWTK